MKFIATDSDVRPVRTHLVTWREGQTLIASGEAKRLMSGDHYTLTWATRFGATRWFVFPKDGAL